MSLVGKKVHLGLGSKGGAGFKGVVIKDDSDTVHIKSIDKHYDGISKKMIHKTYKGPKKFLTIDESEQLDEISKKTLSSYIDKSSAHAKNLSVRNNHIIKAVNSIVKNDERIIDKEYHDELGQKFKNNIKKIASRDKYKKLAQTKVLAKEDVEQLDELSKKTIQKYLKNNARSKNKLYAKMDAERDNLVSSKDPVEKAKSRAAIDHYRNKLVNRHQGQWRAEDKLKEEAIEPLDEISKKTINNYLGKTAEYDSGVLSAGSDTEKARKRKLGIARAKQRKLGSVIDKSKGVQLDGSYKRKKYHAEETEVKTIASVTGNKDTRFKPTKEKRFINKHVVLDDKKNKHKNDNSKSMKVYNRTKEHDGYMPGEDEKMYESLKIFKRLKSATGAKTKTGAILAALGTVGATTLGGALAGGKSFGKPGAVIGGTYALASILNRMRKAKVNEETSMSKKQLHEDWVSRAENYNKVAAAYTKEIAEKLEELLSYTKKWDTYDIKSYCRRLEDLHDEIDDRLSDAKQTKKREDSWKDKPAVDVMQTKPERKYVRESREILKKLLLESK